MRHKIKYVASEAVNSTYKI